MATATATANVTAKKKCGGKKGGRKRSGESPSLILDDLASLAESDPPDIGGGLEFIPTPEQIRAACLAIQDEWGPATRQTRERIAGNRVGVSFRENVRVGG